MYYVAGCSIYFSNDGLGARGFAVKPITVKRFFFPRIAFCYESNIVIITSYNRGGCTGGWCK